MPLRIAGVLAFAAFALVAFLGIATALWRSSRKSKRKKGITVRELRELAGRR